MSTATMQNIDKSGRRERAPRFCKNQQGLRVIWYSNYDEVKGLMLGHGSCTDEEHICGDLKSVLR